jgi:hypothetical protein
MAEPGIPFRSRFHERLQTKSWESVFFPPLEKRGTAILKQIENFLKTLRPTIVGVRDFSFLVHFAEFDKIE